MPLHHEFRDEAGKHAIDEDSIESKKVAVVGVPMVVVESNLDVDEYPEGGLQAWLSVAGASLAMACTFGWIATIGIFQEYYQSGMLSHYSPSTISWIGSSELAILLFGGAFVGRIYDTYGPRWLLIIGTFLHVFGLMMASISTKYYQFILSQAICSGIGMTCLFSPCKCSAISRTVPHLSHC